MKIIVVRHGETVDNARRILTGHMPGVLSEDGIAQARSLALKLKDEKIDVIYSSDLKRAVDTTMAIAEYHNVPIIYTEDLREQNYGIFQGRPRQEHSAARGHNPDYRPRGGESTNEVRDRAKRFLKQLMKDRSLGKKTVLISAHGGIARSIFSILAQVSMTDALKLKPRNTGMLVFEVSEGQARLLKDDMFSQPVA